jgi:hypothetical protein
MTYGNSAGEPASVLWTGSTWQTISGGAAGNGPVLFGVDDTGLVLGWNVSASPYAPFLWKGTSVELSKARREVTGGIQPAGLTASGTIYALDYGDNTSAPQPVAFRPVANTTGDGAAEETAGPLSDADGDSIPDAMEAEVGTSAALADTDGDGWADLFELVFQRNANAAEPFPSLPGGTGLMVLTPHRHPLQRNSAELP